MLCRVFHKAKTENTNHLSPQDVFEVQEATAGDTSPPVSSSNKISPLAFYHQYQQYNQIAPQGPPPYQHSNNLLQLPSLSPNFLQLSHQFHNDTSTTLTRVNDIMMLNTKRDDQDDYKFLLDMNFEDELDSNMHGIMFDDCL